MSNYVHAKLIRELFANGFSVRMDDPDLEYTVYDPSPKNLKLAISDVECIDGGADFDALKNGKRVGTVYTAIGYGNGPDETVHDWGRADGIDGEEFSDICERIVCP